MTGAPLSPNVLFETHVDRTQWLSFGFLRLTLTGPNLHLFAAHGLDQRIKILVPQGDDPLGLDDLLPETDWRRRWRALPLGERPALRSYTASAVRPDRAEIDVDFYVHETLGPASSWALAAAPGTRLLISGPRANAQPHGIQWMPGPAHTVLLAGDETAFPAIRGIVAALPTTTSARILIEVGDPTDAAWLTAALPGHTITVHRRRAGASADGTLLTAVAAWALEHGSAAAASGDAFYAWLATESGQVAQLRDTLHRAGIAPARVHSQGYWNSKPRAVG